MSPIERTHSLAQWAEKLGISRAAIHKRMNKRPNPAFDQDGYPTRETLVMIENWRCPSNFAIKDLLSFCKDAWRYGWPVRKGGRGREQWIYVATGGWSGNESIICALEGNRMFWIMCWLESHRGGGYKFKTSPFSE